MPQIVDNGYAADDTRTWAQANTSSANPARQPLQLKGTGKVSGVSARPWSCLDGIWDILADGPTLLQSNPKVIADVLRMLLVLWQVLSSRPIFAATPFGRPYWRCGWSSPVSVLVAPTNASQLLACSCHLCVSMHRKPGAQSTSPHKECWPACVLSAYVGQIPVLQ